MSTFYLIKKNSLYELHSPVKISLTSPRVFYSKVEALDWAKNYIGTFGSTHDFKLVDEYYNELSTEDARPSSRDATRGSTK